MLLVIVCLLAVTTVSQLSCAQNYTWSTALNTCYPNQPYCATNHQWNGTICTPRIICPDLYFYDGNNCVTVAYGCTSGFFPYRDTCVNCPLRFIFDSNNKACAFSRIDCPANQFWNGNNCLQIVYQNVSTDQGQINNLSSIQTGSMTIIGNQVFPLNSGFSQITANNVNIPIQTVICPTNFQWDGRACVSNSTPGQIIRQFN